LISFKEDLKGMFPITAKVKIAAGIAAGALTLGAAGAYAATANNTIKATNPTPVTLGSSTTGTLNVVTFNNGSLGTTPTFTNAGQCVSWLAGNKNVALASSLSSSNTLPKNYHGKLMSKANAWCKTQLPATTKTDSAETETPDATESAAPETDSTDSTSGAANGHGHGHGHGNQANETD
jgi:hypothetical protein